MAPRFATATFRLLYTSISCVSALVLFHAADWWPHYVFGTHPQASTRNCWDLSGSFILLEDDNDVLRVQKEISILKKLRHKNIIQLYEVMESKKNLYITRNQS